MNKRHVGNDKEDMVCLYLQGFNIEILDRNFYTRHGEIDIVGKDGDYLVFFEVKYRKDDSYGDPLEAISYSKKKRIYNAARVYLYLKHYPENTFIRFDCVGVTGSRINWVKAAF